MAIPLRHPALLGPLTAQLAPNVVDYAGTHYIAVSEPDGMYAYVWRVSVVDGEFKFEEGRMFKGETAHQDATREAWDRDVKASA